MKDISTVEVYIHLCHAIGENEHRFVVRSENGTPGLQARDIVSRHPTIKALHIHNIGPVERSTFDLYNDASPGSPVEQEVEILDGSPVGPDPLALIGADVVYPMIDQPTLKRPLVMIARRVPHLTPSSRSHGPGGKTARLPGFY